jgi:DNA-binding response OmpR family regulator
MSRGRILVVDDEKKIVESCRLYLEHDGFEVVTAYNGEQALAEARESRPDLVVLDLMLPRVDGLEVCRRLRAESSVPILMLTARSTEEDKLLGLELGADDYLTKPFSPRELVARVRAILRRAPPAGAPLRFDGLEVDLERHEARRRGEAVALTPREFDLLVALARAPGRAFTRARLVEAAFGDDAAVLERTVDAHVMNLRHKIEDDPAAPRLIVTVPGVGYRFEGEPAP